MKLVVKMLKNELWWGGTNVDGCQMPFNKSTRLTRDFRRNAPNETMPLFISNLGRIIWSEDAFEVDFKNGEITLEGDEEIILIEGGNTLKDAFLYARQKFFPTDGRVLNREFFKTVQYNTWIECLYDPTQEHVLRYAHAIIDNGFEPGILMIDEGWHGRYGNWTFDPLKFPDPKAMVNELHGMGFKVLLWVVPLVCPDGKFFIDHYNESNSIHKEDERLFIRTKKAPYVPALFHWWNGFSAILNLDNPTDFEFLDNQLQNLINDYGIDGFKFDGGSVDMYENCINGGGDTEYSTNLSSGLNSRQLNFAWNKFASKYDYHEYKDTFKGAALNTIQRLCDRAHRWENNGIDSLIPMSIAQGLIGHPFICPDMVGGGSWVDFNPGKPIDGELFVRWAQCSAMFPMMQYSKAPWDCLSPEHCNLVIEAGKLHSKMNEEIIEMVTRSEQSGEPILRNLEYNYPHEGYAHILDEFMLEDEILVAPVITKDTYSRQVVLPKGKWLADDGKEYEGGTYKIDCPLERLIWFRKMS